MKTTLCLNLHIILSYECFVAYLFHQSASIFEPVLLDSDFEICEDDEGELTDEMGRTYANKYHPPFFFFSPLFREK